MKKALHPSTLALLLVASIFILATMLGGCAKVTQLRGDKEYKRFNYASAISHYKSTLSKKKNQQVRLRLADSYRRTNQTQLAERHYRKVVNLPLADRYHFARVLMINGKYADARKLILMNLRARPDDQAFQVLLASSDSLSVYLDSEPEFEIQREPAPINKLGSNFGTTFFGNGIVFASERPSTGKGREAGWTGQHFLDLFYAEQSQLGEWSDPIPLNGKVNSPYHEGIAAFAQDEKTVFFTRNNFHHGRKHQGVDSINYLQLFYAKGNDGSWKNVRSFPYNSNSYSTGHPALAADGQTLYFISDMPGGYGGTDIYVTSWIDGEFSEPVNLGAEVNTPGNEMFPSLQGDDVLYFASNGHPGIGGLDLFKARLRDMAWGQVENMRAPLNSSRDDFALIMDDTGEYGYLSSNRNTQNGTDEIFSFVRRQPALILSGIALNKVTRDPLPHAEVTLRNLITGEEMTVPTGPLGAFSFPIEADQRYKLVGTKEMYLPDSRTIDTQGITRPLRTVLELDPIKVNLKGIVVNNRSGKPIPGALVELRDNRDQSVETVRTSPDGKFEFPVLPGTVYTLRSEKERYFDKYASLSTQDVTTSETFYKELRMDSLEVGKIFVLENIYYNFDKSDIRADAAIELDKLVRVLKANPRINIELGSHTDSRGSDPYNLRLSDRRARSAVAYIISRGISPSRVTARGYGETRLVNACANGVTCSDEDHQLNRRTEFKVTSYGGQPTAMER